ncbi:MAG: branched-chain amino acid transport system II carrier protein [Anaerovoracaceae bacterium]|nr:branched-chain amino acid transport system II carrier protein [Anaerovoracaceae bacterium]
MENNKPSKGKLSAIICMGLALFATEFGAGNLIFPPFLGRNTGTEWFTGFIGFFIMDAGLAAAAVYSVVANRRGGIDGVVGKIGRVPGKIMLTVIILCIGPCVAIPRTAATTYEMGISTLVPQLPQWLFSAIFFGIVALFVIRPTKVVDIIGNYLTPVLLTVMVTLIIIGIVNPAGAPIVVHNTAPMHEGILNGYQTMDGMAGVLMALMLVTAAQGYGFTKGKGVRKAVAIADIIAAVLLGLVYGGLTYLGATVSGLPEFAGLKQAPLMIAITNKLLGGYGVIALAIIVLMACLTTAIGLSSVAGNYFEELTNGKLKYKQVAIAVIGVSFVMSNFGLSKIISIAAPILNVLYPPLIVLVVMALFDRKITNDRVTGFATYAALLTSVSGAFGIVDTSVLPFASNGLEWIIPAVIGGVIGAIAGKVLDRSKVERIPDRQCA